MFLLSNLCLYFIVIMWIQHALLPYRINDFHFHFFIFHVHVHAQWSAARWLIMHCNRFDMWRALSGSLYCVTNSNCDIYQTDGAGAGNSAITITNMSDVTSAERYDTIRDAILTCGQTLTWVSLIYHMEPTSKKWKTEKLKSKNQIWAEIIECWATVWKVQ